MVQVPNTFNGIKQPNRNRSCTGPSVDGIKTGFTDDAGYCLAASALRDGMRFVSVVMKAESEKTAHRRDPGVAELRLPILREPPSSTRPINPWRRRAYGKASPRPPISARRGSLRHGAEKPL